MLKSPKVPRIDSATTHAVEDGSALFFVVWTSMHRFGLLLLEVPCYENLSTVPAMFATSVRHSMFF